MRVAMANEGSAALNISAMRQFPSFSSAFSLLRPRRIISTWQFFFLKTNSADTPRGLPYLASPTPLAAATLFFVVAAACPSFIITSE